MIYRKIPLITPGLEYRFIPLFEDLYSGELITGEAYNRRDFFI